MGRKIPRGLGLKSDRGWVEFVLGMTLTCHELRKPQIKWVENLNRIFNFIQIQIEFKILKIQV